MNYSNVQSLSIDVLIFIEKLKENNYVIDKDLKYELSELERKSKWYVNENDVNYVLKVQKLFNKLNIKVRGIKTKEEIKKAKNFNAFLISNDNKNDK